MHTLAAIAIVLIVSVSGATAAADVTLVTDSRELAIAATGLGCAIEEVVFTPSSPFAPFAESHTLPADLGGSITAAQDSFVGTTLMGGDGMVSTTALTSHFCGISTYQVTFQLDEEGVYVFDGTLTTADDEANGQFWLGGGGDTQFFISVSGFDSQQLQETGELPAGEYTLLVTVRTGAAGTADFEFSMELLPAAVAVPATDAPAVLALFAVLALAGAAGCGRAASRLGRARP